MLSTETDPTHLKSFKNCSKKVIYANGLDPDLK